MKGMFEPDRQKPTETQDAQGLVKLTSIADSINKLRKSVEEPTSVENFDEVKLHLRNELKILYNNLQKAFSGIKIPDSFKIEGIPKYPDKVSIDGITVSVADLERVIHALHDLRADLAQVDFNPQIDVKHSYPDIKIPEIKAPVVKVPDIKVPTPEVTVNNEVDLSELLNALKPLKLLSNKPTKPVTVRLSDGEKFIEALQEAAKEIGDQLVEYVPGQGLTEGVFKKQLEKFSQSSGIVSNRKAVTAAGTAEKIVAAPTGCWRVDLSADLGNDNPVVIGGADVVAASDSQKGIVLIPGNAPVTIMIDDASKIYVDAQTNGDSVCFNYFTR